MRDASRLLYDQTLDHGGFADTDSPLYDDTGLLHNEIQELAELDPLLLAAIQQAYEIYSETGDVTHYFDWRDVPTDRPHEVMYMLLVYGVDVRKWEELARQARDNNTAIAGITDQ